MKKKILALILCLSLIFSTGLVAAAEGAYAQNVPEIVRILDGIGELVTQLFNLMSVRTSYPDSHPLCSVPELDKGYIPQGFCYVDSHDMFAVSYYSDSDLNSIVSLIDASTGEKVKTVRLFNQSGSACKAHVGGICAIGDSLIVSSGKSVKRLLIEDVLAAEDFGDVRFCGTLNTDMQASYVCSYENQLFVGQFYTFSVDGGYDTPVEQRLYAPGFNRNYAMCEEFDMSDMNAVFEAETAVPEFVISMPNSVQGVAFDGETFVTSASYSRNGASKIRYYKLNESGMLYNMRGHDVPLYFLLDSTATSTVSVPPMVEGIDFYNGKVTGVFESGSNKYSDAKVVTPFICEFERNGSDLISGC